eukprot:GEMP01010090.1.p1 GENE.GEMP01010090.1~~GEMP01010090.1.p1  ORF type:complete len:473 (+),score=45.81 GEMP01010090.1:36-1421(+)
MRERLLSVHDANPVIRGRWSLRWNRMERWVEKKKYLIFSTVLFFFLGLGNTVYFKKMTNAMPNNGYFLSQIATWMYVPVFYSLYISFGEVRTFTLLQVAVMGLTDSLGGVFMLLGGIHTAGSTQALLQQASIPVSVFFSILLLGTHYHHFQYIGAACIILGVLLTKIPDMLNGEQSNSGDVGLFNFIFFLAAIPNGFSGVLKEVVFRDTEDVGVNVLQFWVAVFQTFFTLLSAPIYTLKILGPTSVNLDDVPNLMIDGAKCLNGVNSIVPPTCGISWLNEPPCDTCPGAGIIVVIYMIFNFGLNISQMMLVKHGSAAYFFLVSAARLPVVSIAFSSQLVMGNDAVQSHWTDWIALVVVLGGLFLYRFGGRKLARMLRLVRDFDDPTEIVHEVKPMFAPLGPAPVLSNIISVYRINLVRSPMEIRGAYFGRLGMSSMGSGSPAPSDSSRTQQWHANDAPGLF